LLYGDGHTSTGMMKFQGCGARSAAGASANSRAYFTSRHVCDTGAGRARDAVAASRGALPGREASRNNRYNPTLMPRRLFVTSALPYANGDIHLGHLVGYIQA